MFSLILIQFYQIIIDQCLYNSSYNCRIFIMLRQIIKILEQFQAEKYVTLSISGSGNIQKRNKNDPVLDTVNDTEIDGTISTVNDDQLHRQFILELSQKGIQVDFEYNANRRIIFQDYGTFINVLDQNQVRLVHQKDDILLVNFWAVQSHYCRNNIQLIQQIAQKNLKNWKGKVKIIGLNIATSQQTVKDNIYKAKLQNIINLIYKQQRTQYRDFIIDFKIREFPFFCLVNKSGIIDQYGYFLPANIENRINELLSQTEDNHQKKIQLIQNISSGKMLQSNRFVQEIQRRLSNEMIQKYFENVDFIALKYSYKGTFKNRVQKNIYKIQAYVKDGDQVAQAVIKEYFGNHQNLQLKVNRVKYIPIPKVQHPQCFNCQVKDLQYPYYWLKWQGQLIFGCRSCVEMKSTIPGHHYFYEKNSILLCGPWETISLKDIGQNIQPNSLQQVQKDHNYRCSAVQGAKGIGNARYVGLGVRQHPNFKKDGYLDLCEECMEGYIQKKQEIIDSLIPYGYSPNYPFLRVLYNVNGYYDY